MSPTQGCEGPWDAFWYPAVAAEIRIVQHRAFLLLPLFLLLLIIGIFRAPAADTSSQVSPSGDTVPWNPTMRGWIRPPPPV